MIEQDLDWDVAEQLLQVALQTPVSMYMRDREGRYRWFNQATVRFMDRAPEDIAGRRDEELFRQSSSSRTRDEDEEVMRTGLPMVTRCRVHTFDGRQLEFVVEKYPCRDRAGQVVGVIGVARDVTKLREAEAARSERDRLQSEQATAMRATDALKDAFLGIISHELRTPIHVIMGFCSVLQRGILGELSTGQADYLGRLHDVAQELGYLVDDLLDMSQIQAGTFAVRPEPMALAPLARHVLQQLAPLAEHRGVQLQDELPEGLPEVQADPRRIQQVIANIIANALKFTLPGGCVRVTAFTTPRGLRCEIRDTGLGIREEDFQRLFDPFVQIESSVTRAGGAGLGLAVARAIIASHRGEIGVFSQLERGSTFWFELPLGTP